MAWTPGQVLQGGKYTIEHRLGQGGFGITYLAQNKRGHRVVIKILKDIEPNSPDFDKRQQDFVNQALRLKGCQHPHIVEVYELIKEGHLWGIVMEYIAGETLAHCGILSEYEALHYIEQIGEALTLVHQNRLLHRDVKPQNIMVRADQSEAVLIDFGIAREFIPDLTLTHTTHLTPTYAPPEQYNSRDRWSPCTDVYALAATLYRLLTGTPPTSSVSRIIGSTLTPPQQLNPSISDAVNGAILQGMDLKPKNRPQSVQEWLTLLREPRLSNIIHVPQVDDLSSDVRVDYRNLRELLASGRWQEADRETTDLMLNIVERQAEGWLKLEDIHTFPCTELCAIDQLWVNYSKGRFGFSVHERIWQSVRSQFPKQQDKPSRGDGYETYKKFGSCVGWYVEAKDYWLNSDELSFTLDAPPGHLPSGKKWTMKRIKGKSGELRMGRGWCLGGGVSSLTSRLVECQLSRT